MKITIENSCNIKNTNIEFLQNPFENWIIKPIIKIMCRFHIPHQSKNGLSRDTGNYDTRYRPSKLTKHVTQHKKLNKC